MKTAFRILPALVLGLVLVELLLRAAGWAYIARSMRGDGGGDGPVIVCHGDSNVFGVYEPSSASYPSHLQRIANERSAQGARVVNLGVPGLSSSQIVASLPAELVRLDPAAVIVTVGANNGWSWTPDEGFEVSVPWFERLRIVRFLRIVKHRFSGAPGATNASEDPADLSLEDDDSGGRSASIRDREGRVVSFRAREEGAALVGDAYDASIRRDLAALAAAAEEAGTRLFVATYGADRSSYGMANAVLRAAAEELGIGLIDPSAEVARLEQVLGFEAVFHADLHPRGPGYEVIAKVVFNALVDAGLLEGERVEDVTDGVTAAERASVAMSLRGSLFGEEGLDLLLASGTPDREFTVVLWGLRDASEEPPPLDFEQLQESDPLFALTSKSEELRGRFDAEGRATLSLSVLVNPNLPPQQLDGRALSICVITHPPSGRHVLSRISDAAHFRIP